MATLLDIGLLQEFHVLFPFLLVFVMLYAVMQARGILGTNKGLHALIALLFAFMTLFSPIARRTVEIMTPWMVILVIFLVLGLLVVMTLGPSTKNITDVITNKKHKYIVWWVISLALLVAFGSLFKAIGETGGVPGYVDGGDDSGHSSQEEEFFKTLFHPKLLGLVFIMVVSLFAVMLLTGSSAPT